MPVGVRASSARVAGEAPAPALRIWAVTVIVEPHVVVGAETARVLPSKSDGWSGVIVM